MTNVNLGKFVVVHDPKIRASPRLYGSFVGSPLTYFFVRELVHLSSNKLNLWLLFILFHNSEIIHFSSHRNDRVSISSHRCHFSAT
jgi:hypothetical protein